MVCCSGPQKKGCILVWTPGQDKLCINVKHSYLCCSYVDVLHATEPMHRRWSCSANSLCPHFRYQQAFINNFIKHRGTPLGFPGWMNWFDKSIPLSGINRNKHTDHTALGQQLSKGCYYVLNRSSVCSDTWPLNQILLGHLWVKKSQRHVVLSATETLL